MRYAMLIITAAPLAACASSGSVQGAASIPTYAPVETVTISGTVADATERLAALYTARHIPIASTDGGTVTTAPVGHVALVAGSGAAETTGSVDYFYRATVTGSGPARVTLALWTRFTTRAGADPASPARESPATAQCLDVPACSVHLGRMRQYADALRTR